MNAPGLKWLLGLFFIALVLPSSVLVYHAYGQLRWEAFYHHQQLARELTLRIDASFAELIAREQKRSIQDYDFLHSSAGEPSLYLQRSPLSLLPFDTQTPGLLGYFQVDTQGRLYTPTLPLSDAAAYGIGADELDQRQEVKRQLEEILVQNRLLFDADSTGNPATQEQAPASSLSADIPQPDAEPESFAAAKQSSLAVTGDVSGEAGLSVFDQLNSESENIKQEREASRKASRVKDLKLEDSYQVGARLREEDQLAQIASDRQVLAERAETMGQSASAPAELDKLDEVQSRQLSPAGVRIDSFERALGNLEFSRLETGQFVLFRQVWRDQERYVQGLLLDPDEFIEQLIARAFAESTLSSMTDLILAYKGNVVQRLSARYAQAYMPDVQGGSNELLYQSRLVAPFSELELIFSLARLPLGAGGKVIIWSALVLLLVLVLGFLMLLKLGMRQLALARQQQDFVSAVSHELKTPLTSIRMYGEMLREGWADEARKKSYYDFIFHESERLSRLINNVLHLARMTRNEHKARCEIISVAELIDNISPRLVAHLESAGFWFEFDCDENTRAARLSLDEDWYTQILINLVDNAIKFSASATPKKVMLRCHLTQQHWVKFSVRDFGPGIASDQMQKIFTLFYRSENELTRETMGTGIGLALVHQLVTEMGGEIDVVNRHPGAEFTFKFRALH